MKTIVLICTAMLLACSVKAQDTPRQHEVGLTFQNFDSFGLTYRTGTANALWRFSAFNFSMEHSKAKWDVSSNVTKYNRAGLGIAFGKEFRKSIHERFAFRYGGDIVAGFNLRSEKYSNGNPDTDVEQKYQTFYGGFNFMVGLNYALGEKVVIGVELLPSLRYTNDTQKSINSTSTQKTTTDGMNFGISNSSALLSLVYRW